VGAGKRLEDKARTVHDGGSFVSTSLAAKLLQDFTEEGSPQSVRLPPLTKREEQILSGIGRGLSNKEIARELDLQEKTIKHYVTNVLQKLQVRGAEGRRHSLIHAGRGPASPRRKGP
jgi:two-component system, NarL family, nitrate/nitrite response regulator NarL